MAPVFLLDTNIVSYFIRGNFPALRDRIVSIPLESLAISAITEAELRYWVLCRPDSQRTRVGVNDFLTRVASLPWDSGATATYAATRDALKRRGLVLSTQDLMIAAHALSLDVTLITHDKAFAFIEDLRTQDWT